MTALSMSKEDGTVRIIQLTDPHLGPTADYRLAGIRTLDSLSRVLHQLAPSSHSITKLIATGDIAGHGDEAAYRLFDEQLAALDIPYHWLPGNHDEPDVMHRSLSTPFRFEVVAGNWLLLMLNSKQPGKVGGRIDEDELIAATTAVLKHNGPVAVFVHHPPIEVGCAWIDRQKIENADDLLQQLSACDNVKAIFAGHVHQPFNAHYQGIDIYTSPSTCFQFATNSDEFALGKGGPGFRWIDLRPDGTIVTDVVQLAENAGRNDRRCIGY